MRAHKTLKIKWQGKMISTSTVTSPAAVRRRGLSRSRAGLFLGTLLPITVLLGGVASAQSLPSNGQVVSGQATISGSSNALTVSQSTDKAIINWDSFSIGQGQSVQFNNGNGATLNRVTGTALSSIDGILGATGSVYLINPNGVIVGKSGVINVGGTFVGSTLNVSDANFKAGGDLTFSGASDASVVNLGKIGALGGDVTLMAAHVRNDGSISAANGSANLIAGRNIILSDSSGGNSFLVVSGGADTSVTNTGAITAAQATLEAEGGSIYALAGNTSGLIRATGVSTQDGRIRLTAGDGGSVTVDGTTLAATKANGDGGDIAITGQSVTVGADAALDASSAAGQGGTISAIAGMTSGNLSFKGSATATGDTAGGSVETSGSSVDFTGARINTTAAHGATGTWLTDPFDLTVDSGAAATISSNLATTNVTLQTTSTGTSGPGNSASANGDININSDITWSSANTLTLDAYRSINFNANVTVSGAGKVALKTNDGGANGDYVFNGGKSLSFTGAEGSGQKLTINSTDYTLLYSMKEIDLIDGSDQQAGTGTAASAGGNYALATSLNAAGVTYSKGLVGTSSTVFFTGNFTGLGNTISNLTIAHATNSSLGLFGATSGATIRDLGLINPSVTLTSNTDTGNSYGALIGQALAGTTIKNVYATNVTVSGALDTGGLVGRLTASTISNAFVTGSVTANAASGSSTNGTGGLVGRLITGLASTSNMIDNAYSTANVTTSGVVTYVGGLVGDATGSGAGLFASMTNVYATGNVTVSSGSTTTGAGGLVGRLGSSATALGSISNGFATGIVTGTATNTGRFIGTRNSSSTVTNGYYNSDVTGGTSNVNGTGSTTGISGKLTAQLETLNSFDATVWSTNTALGLYPFLTTFSNTNTVAGSAFNADGSAAASAAVAIYTNGTLLNTATSAGDGSYSYSFLTPITLTTKPAIGATLTLSGAGSISGASYNSGGAVSGFNLKSGGFTYATSDTSYSGLLGDLSSTFGATPYAAISAAQGSGSLTIGATGAFTIDQAINQSGTAFVEAGGGSLTLSGTGSVASSASGTAVTLASNGAFVNNAGASAVTANNGRWLIYSQSSNDPTTIDADVDGGLSGKSYYNDAFNFTTGTLASTPNSGNRFVHGSSPVLTVTPDTTSVTYNGNAQSDTYSVTGYLGSDQAGDSLTGSVGGLTTSSKNAGSYSLTASGSLTSDENYTVNVNGTGTLTINPAALTLTAVTDTKTYDATTSSAQTPQASGLVGGDTVSGLSESFDSPNAGNRTLSVNSGYTINDGNGGGNYTVSTVNVAGFISAMAVTTLTWNVANGSSTYGSTPVLGAVTLNGVLASDAGNVSGTEALFSGSTQVTPSSTLAAGTYAEKVTGLTGSAANNYVLATTGNTAGVYIVNPKLLTVSLIGSTSKTYDGTTTAALTGSNYSLGGVVGTDNVSLVTASSGTYADKNAGSGKTVTANGLSLTGSAAGNYTIATQASGAIGTINKASLTAFLTGTVSKTYDGTTTATLAANNYSLTGAISGDKVTLNNPTSGTYSDKNAGSGKTVAVTGLALTGADAGNYTVNTQTSAAIGSIAQASLTVTANNQIKAYGANDPALTYSVTTGTLYSGDSLSGALTRDAGELPGGYAIDQGTLAASSNYKLSFVPGTLTVLSKPQQDNIVFSQDFVLPSLTDLPATMPTETTNTTTTGGGCTDTSALACLNQPYPDNKTVSASITFSGL